VRDTATIFPRPCKLTFDLLTLKEASESRVTWTNSVQILVFYIPTVTAAAAWRVNAAVSKAPRDLDLWPFNLESGVRVTCDAGYLCANFNLPRHVWGSIYATNRRQTASSLSLVDYNLSSANLQFSTACGDASLFGVKFFGMDELITRSNISPVDYKILYLLCRRLLGAGA